MSSSDSEQTTDWRNMRRVAKPKVVETSPVKPQSNTFCPVFVKPVSSPSPVAPTPAERTLKKGEFGKDPEQLAQLEKSGFVMSGARSNRIAMIREIKQAEVVTEEQQKELTVARMKEREEREDALIEGFRELLRQKRKR